MSRLIRVGRQVINLDNATEVVLKNSGEVHVYFLGDVDDDGIPVNHVSFTGLQADALRNWMESETEYVPGSGSA